LRPQSHENQDPIAKEDSIAVVLTIAERCCGNGAAKTRPIYRQPIAHEDGMGGQRGWRFALSMDGAWDFERSGTLGSFGHEIRPGWGVPQFCF
jgi:hypothetical protein